MIHSPDLFSQDFEVTSVEIVGGNSFCSETSPKSLTISVTNNLVVAGGPDVILAGQVFTININGDPSLVNTTPFDVVLKSDNSFTRGGLTKSLIFPTDFNSTARTLSFSTQGIYSVTVSLTWTNGTDPVDSNNVSRTTNLTVFTPDVFTLSASSDRICQGETVTYTINGGAGARVAPSATATYTFRVQGAVVQSIMGNNVMTFLPGTIASGDTVTIDVIDGQSNPLNGCVADTSTISHTIVIDTTTPATLVSNSSPSLTVCAGETIVLTAGPTGSGATFRFLKNGSAADATRITANVYTPVISGHTTITVFRDIGSAPNICTVSKTIVINAPVLANGGALTIPSLADRSICPGGPLPDIASTTGATTDTTLPHLSSPGSLVTYQWQTRTGEVWQDIDGATTETYVAAATPVTLNATTEVRRLAFASINGVICPTGGTPASSNITFNVDVDRLPVITLNDPDNTVCASAVTGLIFTATTASPTSTDSFQWVINNTNVGAAVVGASATYTPAAGALADGDVVKVRVTTAAPYSCTYTSAAGSEITINIDDEPVANLSNNTLNLNTMCSGESVIFTASNAGVIAGASFSFTLSGTTVNPAHVLGNVYTAPTGTITSTSIVGVTVTKNGCSNTVTQTIIALNLTSGGTIAIPADTSVCLSSSSGDIGSTAAAVQIGPGALSYQWETRVGR